MDGDITELEGRKEGWFRKPLVMVMVMVINQGHGMTWYLDIK